MTMANLLQVWRTCTRPHPEHFLSQSSWASKYPLPFRRAGWILMVMVLCLGMQAQPLLAQDAPRRRGGTPSLKIGFNRQMLSGYNFTLEDTGSGTKYSNASPMQGNELVLEYVFFDRVSIELGVDMTPLARNYELTVGGTKTVTEEKVRSSLGGANLYFNGASGNGFKFMAGLNTGNMAVSHSFQGTGSVLDKKSSAAKVIVNGIKLGIDWISDNAGARLSYSTLTGVRKVKDAPLAGWDETYTYTAAIVTLGIFAFF